MTHSIEKLEAMDPEELDFTVLKVANIKIDIPYLIPYFSTSWDGLGMISKIMLARGFTPDVQRRAGMLVDFGWNRMVQLQGRNRWSYTGNFGPRAAAIAAILAMQGE